MKSDLAEAEVEVFEDPSVSLRVEPVHCLTDAKHT